MVLVENKDQTSFIGSNIAQLQHNREGSFMRQGFLQMLADGCKLDNPLSEISEVKIPYSCQFLGFCIQKPSNLCMQEYLTDQEDARSQMYSRELLDMALIGHPPSVLLQRIVML